MKPDVETKIPKEAETPGLSLGHCPHLEGGKEKPRRQRPWRTADKDERGTKGPKQ